MPEGPNLFDTPDGSINPDAVNPDAPVGHAPVGRLNLNNPNQEPGRLSRAFTQTARGGAEGARSVFNFSAEAARKLADKKILGVVVGDMLAGGLAGGGARTIARIVTEGAVGGPMSIVIAGAASGAASAVMREYLKQRREYNETTYNADLYSRLKHRLKISNDKAIGLAFLRGAGSGAMGASIVGVALQELSHTELGQQAGKTVTNFVRERMGMFANIPSGIHAPNIPSPSEVVPQQAKDALSAVGETGKNLVQDTHEKIIGAGKTTVGFVRNTIPGLHETPPASSAPDLLTGQHYGGHEIWDLDHPIDQPAPDMPIDANPAPTQPDLSTGPQPTAGHDITSIDQTDSGVQPAAAPSSAPVEAPAVVDPVQEAINKLPPSFNLEAGSNPWSTTDHFLEQALGRKPTNAEIMEVTKALCKSSNIAVPEWGIQGEFSHTKLPIGFKLNIDDDVKNAIFKVAKK